MDHTVQVRIEKYNGGTIRRERHDWSDRAHKVYWFAFDANGEKLGCFWHQRQARDIIDTSQGRSPRTEAYLKATACSAEHAEKNDCTVIAVSIVTGRPYDEVHAALARHGREPGKGTNSSVYLAVIREFGCSVIPERHEHCKTVKTAERYLPRHGTFLVRTRGHVLAVRDGKVHDHSRGSCRKVIDILRIN